MLSSSGCIYGQHQGDSTGGHPAGSLLRATERSDLQQTLTDILYLATLNQLEVVKHLFLSVSLIVWVKKNFKTCIDTITIRPAVFMLFDTQLKMFQQKRSNRKLPTVGLGWNPNCVNLIQIFPSDKFLDEAFVWSRNWEVWLVRLTRSYLAKWNIIWISTEASQWRWYHASKCSGLLAFWILHHVHLVWTTWFNLMYALSVSQSRDNGVDVCCVSSGNTQLALQIIKRNQLLPSAVQRVSPDSRKKSIQPFQSVQPIQLPSSFTQVQRKWTSTATCGPPPTHSTQSWGALIFIKLLPLSVRSHMKCRHDCWLMSNFLFPFDWGICVCCLNNENKFYLLYDTFVSLIPTLSFCQGTRDIWQ